MQVGVHRSADQQEALLIDAYSLLSDPYQIGKSSRHDPEGYTAYHGKLREDIRLAVELIKNTAQIPNSFIWDRNMVLPLIVECDVANCQETRRRSKAFIARVASAPEEDAVVWSWIAELVKAIRQVAAMRSM